MPRNSGNVRSGSGGLLAQNRYTAVTTAPFDLQEITLLHVRGVEEISRPFCYELTIVSRRRIRTFATVVGQQLTVGLKLADGGTRYLNGVIRHFSYLGLDDSRRPIYVAEITPWFATLDLRRNSRIFQNMTSLEIVKRVLAEHSMCLVRDTTKTRPPKRVYCVQYEETDLAFVSRMLETDGIYYYFKHSANQHEMVLADSPSAHKPCQPGTIETNLSLSDHRMHEDLFWDWRETVSYQSAQVSLADYNFETPTAQLTSITPVPSVRTGGVPTLAEERAFTRLSKGPSPTQNATTATGRNLAQRELFHYPGKYTSKSEGDLYARIRSEEIAAHAYRVHIIGNARQLCVGDTFVASNPFEISDTTIAPSPSDSWLAVRAEIDIIGEIQDERTRGLIASRQLRANRQSGPIAPFPEIADGEEQHLYRCAISAMPAGAQFRPRRLTPAPVIAGPQTAVVVGRPGDIITTDRYGRIKVQFMWDREGRRNENSSCWIRVAQMMAGKTFGAVATPRVGHEVVVEFLGGDPDQPLVTGTLYNAANMPPEDLPVQSSRTTLRTRSIDGTSNQYNELRFDDQRSGEEVYVRAQRNLAVDVGQGYALTAKDEFTLNLTGFAPWVKRTPQPMSGSQVVMTPSKISFVVSSALGKQALEITDKGVFIVASEIGFLSTKGPVSALPSIAPVPSPPLLEAALSLNAALPPGTANTLVDKTNPLPPREPGK
ncbi:type VI secretion system Vgr family protein [Pararhizobium arenae]|uniref:type VI secretion system Vgr family protein n=1 Tax=Pararhizobium arenae TaxID=1856850 RepID=UPI00094AE0EA|nr:type VI secretion system tip protein TssI/VgrG [Pararhizobium arenae]